MQKGALYSSASIFVSDICIPFQTPCRAVSLAAFPESYAASSAQVFFSPHYSFQASFASVMPLYWLVNLKCLWIQLGTSKFEDLHTD